ncbi:MAG: excinuclease ABC subunit UvrC [Lachnospiraceae bacterium]
MKDGFDLAAELKKLPECPGVYLMHDKNDEIIYVGKAIKLRRRVSSYFRKLPNRSPKIEKMITLIDYFEYIVTDSELEALVLENNLIKEHRPKYNTMLKDDKSYPFMKVTVQEDYPRVLFARQMKRDGAKYFGPYTSSTAVKDTIELVKKLYGIRTCNKSLPKEIGIGRPCLYYQMKQCEAPCQGYISKEDYRKKIDQLLSFLNGDYKKVIKELEQKMKEMSANLEFEEAARYRDLIASVEHVTGSQRVVKTGGIDQDVIAMARKEKETVVSLFFVRDGKLLGREHFHVEHSEEESGSAIITTFIKQYYSGTPFIPNELLTEFEAEETELLEQWLTKRRGGRVHIITPQKGEKHKMIDLARDNANVVLARDIEKLKREEARTVGACNELAKLLGLPSASRLEAFDISNTSGFLSVASMVVFEKGKPRKNEYRKFRLKTVDGPDDYKSMEEVLTRRFTDERMEIYPDILMMDGGRGQVNVALRVLEKLHLDIPVCGMVKDDNHRTRGLYFNNEEINFPKNSEVFGMITRLQDEAHRFAITYHKQLRGKEQVHSVLDDINGIGPKRRKALMQHFKDINKLREAGVEELEAVNGITRQVAESIYSFFHESEKKDE